MIKYVKSHGINTTNVRTRNNRCNRAPRLLANECCDEEDANVANDVNTRMLETANDCDLNPYGISD